MVLVDPKADKLAEFSSKRIVGVLVKWKYPFFTKLQNFKKPKDAALIGVFAEQIKPLLFDGFEAHFDAIYWFKADYSRFNNVYTDSNSLTVPQIDEIVGQIVSVLDKDKICLMETEEFMIDTNCKLREKYGIPGCLTEDIEYLRDKSLLKKVADETGIPTMKSFIFDPRLVKTDKEVQETVESISKKVGFPMFKKPISGCGSGGGVQLDTRTQLTAFIESESRQNSTESYLIEEYIGGPEVSEFWVGTVLYQDGSCRPYQNILCKRGMLMPEHLKHGLPIPFQGGSLEDTSDDFPDLDKFVLSVVEKLRPPHPHPFCVQGFQLKKGSSQYLLTEVGYRVNGARGSPASYHHTGISQETALLSVHLDPEYRAVPDPDRPDYYRAYLWYPYKTGVLMSHSTVPEDAPIGSTIGYNWFVPENTRLDEAANFSHFALFLTIDHSSKHKALEDMAWLETNFKLDIQ